MRTILTSGPYPSERHTNEVFYNQLIEWLIKQALKSIPCTDLSQEIKLSKKLATTKLGYQKKHYKSVEKQSTAA